MASAAKELRLIRKMFEPEEGEASSSRAVPPEQQGGSSSSGSNGDPSTLWREFENLEVHAARGVEMEVGVLKNLLKQLEILLDNARSQLIELEAQKALLETLLAISEYRGEVEDSSSKKG